MSLQLMDEIISGDREPDDRLQIKDVSGSMDWDWSLSRPSGIIELERHRYANIPDGSATPKPLFALQQWVGQGNRLPDIVPDTARTGAGLPPRSVLDGSDTAD